MSKENKFRPNAGFVLAVHHNVAGIRAVSQHLDVYVEDLADAMEKAGWQLVLDPFDLSADAAKIIKIQERQKTEGLKVVQNDDENVQEGGHDE